MYCEKCGDSRTQEASFCKKCGNEFRLQNHASEKIKSETSSGKGANWLFWWRLSDDEIKEQAENYNSLGWGRSARKQSIICIGFSVFLTLVMAALGFIPIVGFIDVVVLMIFGIYIYKGKKWSMVAAMVLWTLEKLYTTYSGFSYGNVAMVLSSYLFWSIYMHAFYLSYRTEIFKDKIERTAHDESVSHDSSINSQNI